MMNMRLPPSRSRSQTNPNNPSTAKKRRVQFARGSCSTVTPPLVLPMNPQAASNWKRASIMVFEDHFKAIKVNTWQSASKSVSAKYKKEVESTLKNFAEVHYPAIDWFATKRATSGITERRRATSAQSSERDAEPVQPEDRRTRPSTTQIKNRLRDHKLPISYNNFIVHSVKLSKRASCGY